MLGWTAEELERLSKIHRRTIRKIERGLVEKPQRGTVSRIVAALEKGGVEFLADGGVRLRTPARFMGSENSKMEF